MVSLFCKSWKYASFSRDMTKIGAMGAVCSYYQIEKLDSKEAATQQQQTIKKRWKKRERNQVMQKTYSSRSSHVAEVGAKKRRRSTASRRSTVKNCVLYYKNQF